MWVDGTLVIDYNGADPASAAYRQTWTRTNDFGTPLQFPSVLNGGAPQAQSQWWITSSSASLGPVPNAALKGRMLECPGHIGWCASWRVLLSLWC